MIIKTKSMLISLLLLSVNTQNIFTCFCHIKNNTNYSYLYSYYVDIIHSINIYVNINIYFVPSEFLTI